MINYPSIDRLLERVDSKYALCTISAKRAHELNEYDRRKKDKDERPARPILDQDGNEVIIETEELAPVTEPLLAEYKSAKNLGRSLEEIASGDVIIDPSSVTK